MANEMIDPDFLKDLPCRPWRVDVMMSDVRGCRYPRSICDVRYYPSRETALFFVLAYNQGFSNGESMFYANDPYFDKNGARSQERYLLWMQCLEIEEENALRAA